jgi:hypothetical protein
MGNRFASGKFSIAECDRCGFRYKLQQLRREVIKTKNYELLVCNRCWDPDHPQLQLGMYPVDDPQGVRNPRPDRSYITSGNSGLQIDTANPNDTSILGSGTNEGGSRIFQWGWNPVGGASANDYGLTPNNLALIIKIGQVTILTT